MQERIEQELALIRQKFPDVEYREEGRWVRVSSYPLPQGWNREMTDVVFQILEGHPTTPPYGMYVPAGMRFQGDVPDNYTEPASNTPPFGGEWGVFSWSHDEPWKPTSEIWKGANLLHWVRGFKDRFEEGK